MKTNSKSSEEILKK